jgi:hypothetical protein
METTDGDDWMAGPQVGSPSSTIPFLFPLGLGFDFLDPIQNRSNFFDFFSFYPKI